MSGVIAFTGVETNNLKNISVKIKKNAINLIIGPSGSGKSSLAYDTIAQIGLHEYLSLFDDRMMNPSYRLKGYNNIIPTVPIQQKNTNNNIQSTIGSYFGINSMIVELFCKENNLAPETFSLQNSENVCPLCHGVGFIKDIDINKVVDGRRKIKDIPFRCWYRYSDFYEKILLKYCNDEGINAELSFSELSPKDKEKLLYGESAAKYSIQYTHGKGRSSRTTKYYGVMLNMPMRKPNYKLPDSYYGRIMCPKCNGMKYSPKVEKIKVEGKSIGQVLTTSFSELQLFLKAQKSKKSDKDYIAVLDGISKFVDKCVELNLGHLFFNRAIPTLSGGELQRLRLVQIFSSQLTDLLIVLDEPLAGLSSDEKNAVLANILSLSNKHTLLIVDHSDSLVNEAENIIALGPKSGINGGQIIDYKKYIGNENELVCNYNKRSSKSKNIVIDAEVYGYKGIQISLIEGGLNIISGKSGIGKSTVLREYLPMHFDAYEYISQKYSSANLNSNVATLLGVAEPIFNLYAKKFDKPITFFSNNSSKQGACKFCGGAGYIVENGLTLECGKCRGTGFDIGLDDYRIKNKSILDVWKMTLEDAYAFFQDINIELSKDILMSREVLLEHLIIGQSTSSLSGGENIRAKLFRLNHSRASVVGIDEPFRGLGKREIVEICSYLNKLCVKGKTIIVAEHEEYAFDYFDNHIDLTLKNGRLITKMEKKQ